MFSTHVIYVFPACDLCFPRIPARTLKAYLHKSEFFSAFEQYQAAKIIIACELRVSNKAKPFVKLGDKANGMFIMFSGNAEVIIPGKLSAGKTEEEKKEGLQEGVGSVVAVIPEGVAFGHLGLLTPGGRRNATVGTHSGHTEALFLDRESYLNLVYQSDVKASQLIQECVKKSGICEVETQ